MSENAASPSAREPDPSTGALVAQISAQTSQLFRDELRLAQLEMTEKGKKAGIGVGLFGATGILAVYGLGCLVAAAVIGLAGPVPAGLAAVIVGAALFLVAGVAALVGKRDIGKAAPPVPTEAVEGAKQDLRTLKSGSSS